MQNNNTAGLENSGTTSLEQALSHLRITPPRKNDPTCQLCKRPLTEGDQITLYLYKPAGSGRYTIGQCRCRTHNDDLTTLFTLGINELIVDGRVGQCRDHATQQTWPVLLAPSIRLISVPETNSSRTPTPETDSEDTEPTEWQYGRKASEQVSKPPAEITHARMRTKRGTTAHRRRTPEGHQ